MPLSYYLPLLLVILSNIFYHNIAKNQPANANAFLTLAIAYSISAIVTFTCFFIFKGNFKADFSNLTWTIYLLGIAIIGIELGYLLMYRNGWTISTAALIANSIVAVLLLIAGFLFYKEAITLTQVIGTILCIIGLVLIKFKI